MRHPAGTMIRFLPAIHECAGKSRREKPSPEQFFPNQNEVACSTVSLSFVRYLETQQYQKLCSRILPQECQAPQSNVRHASRHPASFALSNQSWLQRLERRLKKLLKRRRACLLMQDFRQDLRGSRAFIFRVQSTCGNAERTQGFIGGETDGFQNGRRMFAFARACRYAGDTHIARVG